MKCSVPKKSQSKSPLRSGIRRRSPYDARWSPLLRRLERLEKKAEELSQKYKSLNPHRLEKMTVARWVGRNTYLPEVKSNRPMPKYLKLSSLTQLWWPAGASV